MTHPALSADALVPDTGTLSQAAIDATLKLAVAQHQRGHLALAEALYDQVLTLDPINTDAMHLKGVVALAQGSSLEAIALIERACALLPRSALFHRSRAEVLTALGRSDDACEALKTAIGLKPDWAEAYVALGSAHAAEGRSADAKVALSKATTLDPTLAEAWSNLGVLHLADKHIDDAIAAFEKALAARPGFADALNGMGVALMENGRIDDALATFDQVLSITPVDPQTRADALANRAVALQSLGRWQESLVDLMSASTLLPTRASIWRNAAKSLTALGQLDKAEEACTRALTLDPSDSASRYERAFVRLLRGNIANGFDDYRARPTVDRLRFPAPTERLPTDLSGRQFRLTLEQGLGEHLFFLRYAAALTARGAEIAVETDPKLTPLLKGVSLGHLIGRDNPTPDFEPLLIGDLPFAVNANEAPPPLTLTPDPALRAEMEKCLAAFGPAPYVALTWRAGIHDGKSLSKTIPSLALAEAIAKVPGTLISIQRQPMAGETAELARLIGRPLHDLSALNDDLARMLAALSLFDDYIGVSNTNMHLRAGLRLPARVLLPHPPEFRWMADGERSPWFPEFQIYRAESSGWNAAMAKLKADLAAIS